MRRVYCPRFYQVSTSPAPINTVADKCDNCGCGGHQDYLERSDALYTERRVDGFHISWYDPLYKGKDADDVIIRNPSGVFEKKISQGYNHKIIVKGLNDNGNLNQATEIRFRAFTITLLSGDEHPKKVQKKWEKIFSESISPGSHYDLPDGFDEAYAKVKASIKKHYTTEHQLNKNRVQWSLERSIAEAYEFFSQEEIDIIVNEAIVSLVLDK